MLFRSAPDLMGSGMNPNAPFVTTLGPNFSVVPCHMPFQGMVLGPNCGGGIGGGFGGGAVNGFPGVPYNPFIRSPRDFFMLD